MRVEKKHTNRTNTMCMYVYIRTIDRTASQIHIRPHQNYIINVVKHAVFTIQLALFTDTALVDIILSLSHT